MILHPNIITNLDSYKQMDGCYLLLQFHRCGYKNRNGTRKKTDYKRGNQCLIPTNNPNWRKTKDKYKDKVKIYFTRQPPKNLKWPKITFITHLLASKKALTLKVKNYIWIYLIKIYLGVGGKSWH